MTTPAQPRQLDLPITPTNAGDSSQSQPLPAALLLYTIGHSNQTADEFIAHLQQHRISVLVDVRSAPYSRFVPHFNKVELETLLPARAIDYIFAGEGLGGRPADPSVYSGGDIDYGAVMARDWYQGAVAWLVESLAACAAAGVHLAVMCSEGDPFTCHRHHLIARSLVDPRLKLVDEAVEVQHILRDGSLLSVNPAAFAEQAEQLSFF